MTLTIRPGDEHLNETERWARDRLEFALGRQLRVTDLKGGPGGRHDLEDDLSNGSVAAIEVTSEVEPDRLSVESEIRRRGLTRRSMPGLRCLWSVRLADDADVAYVNRHLGDMQKLLSDLESQGARYAHARGHYRDPVVDGLRKLGIAGAYRLSTQRGGGVLMGSDAYGGWGWGGSAIDTWLGGFLASDQGVKRLKKLARATTATEHHLVIVLDSCSQPGMGIPLGLTDRDEPGAAPYDMPSHVPPDPLTHLWLLPRIGTEGLRWIRGRGWEVLQLSSGGT